jgi:hypothetical protein
MFGRRRLARALNTKDVGEPSRMLYSAPACDSHSVCAARVNTRARADALLAWHVGGPTAWLQRALEKSMAIGESVTV